MMMQQLIDGLLNQNEGDAVDDMGVDQMQQDCTQ